jgi:hypothetical protein
VLPIKTSMPSRTIAACLLLLGLFILAAAVGCQRQARVPGAAEDAVEPLPLSPADSLLLQAEPVLLASLRRASCYGRCPAYEVQFFYHGEAIYRGERFVPLLGTYQASVPDSLLREILRRAEALRFMELLDAYPPAGPALPDLPPTTTFLYDGRQRKTVVNHYEAPLPLLRFEQFLDEAARKLDWQPRPE